MSERKFEAWYNDYFRGKSVDNRRLADCEACWQAALADRPEQPVEIRRTEYTPGGHPISVVDVPQLGFEQWAIENGFNPAGPKAWRKWVELHTAPVALPEPAQPPIWHRTVENDLEQELLHRERIAAARYVDIVFDGPPSHESGRFVEVEDASGKSIKFGEWVHRPDGYWALRIAAPQEPAHPVAQAIGHLRRREPSGEYFVQLLSVDPFNPNLHAGSAVYAVPPSHPAPSEAGAERQEPVK